MNDSVRNNILFGAKYDRERYEQVVYACCLLRDLDVLPKGDKTMIGVKVTNLCFDLSFFTSLSQKLKLKVTISIITF